MTSSPSRSSFVRDSKPFHGVLICVLIILGLEARRFIVGQPLLTPEPWPVIGVVFAAFVGGIGPGLFASMLAWIYFVFIRADYQVAAPRTSAEVSSLLSWAVALPTIAFLAGLLKDRVGAARAAEAARLAREAEAAKQEEIETKLRLSESRRLAESKLHAEVLNAMPIQVALIDGAGRFIAINDTWRRALARNATASHIDEGASIDALIDAASPECKPIARQAVEGIRRVIEGRDPEFMLEYPAYGPDGQRWTRALVVPIQVSGRRGTLLLQEEVTRRRHAEQSLAEERNLLRLVVDHVPAAVYITDEHGRYRASNPEHRKLIGVSDESHLLGRTLAEVRPDVSGSPAEAANSASLRGEVASSTSIEPWRDRDGRSRILLTSRAAIRDRDDKIIGMVGASRDITDLQSTLAALRQSEEQIEHLFERLPEPSIIFDPVSGHILAANDVVQRLARCTAEQMIGHPITEFLQTDDTRWIAAEPSGVIILALLQACNSPHVQVEASVMGIRFAGQSARLALLHDVSGRVGELQALRRSESHFHSLADSAAVLIWMVDRAGRATYFNRAWLSFRGRLLDEEVHAGLWAAVHEEDLGRTRRLMEESLESGKPWSADVRLIRADGSACWMLVQAVPRLGPTGVLEGMTGSCTDVSEMRRAVDIVRSSEAALRALLLAIPDPIFRIRRDGTYVGFSTRADSPGPIAPERVLGRRVSDVLDPELGRLTMDAIQRTLATTTPTTFEYQRTSPESGQQRHYEVRIVTCGADEVLAIVRDITQRKITEEALRQSEERVRTQLSRMPIACMLLDKDMRVLEWNPAAERIFGWSADEVLSRDVVPLIVPDDVRVSVDRVIEHLRAGDMGAHSTNENLTKSGRRIICEWFNTPIVASDGTVTAILATAIDVTEKKRIEEELRQSQKMDAIGHLAGGVAHDFNNLLTAIFGYTNLARRTLAAAHPANSALDRVEEAARQASGVTKALLTFSRESGGAKGPYQLPRAVRDAVRLIRRTLPSQIELRTSYDLDAPVWVSGDPTQMQQVVLNLAINARDAMPEGGVLKIDVDVLPPHQPGQPRGTAILRVSDTGVGMSEQVQRRIFEPFFTTKPPGEGTGLGLAIVHGIVREHQGRIEVESSPGKGATFTIRLPLVEPPEEVPAENGGMVPSRGKGELVLLADDYTYVREIISSMLTSLGYRVVQASDGPSLLTAYHKHQAEARVIIVDEDMPGLSGMACLEDIRRGGGTTPALVITGNASVAPNLPGVKVLRKPFQMGELATALADAMGRDASPPGGRTESAP